MLGRKSGILSHTMDIVVWTAHKRAVSQNMPNHRLGEQDPVGDALLVPCIHTTPHQHPCVTGSEGHHTDWGLGDVVVQPLCLVAKQE